MPGSGNGSAGAGGGKGWDLFKGSPIDDLKKRLERAAAGSDEVGPADGNTLFDRNAKSPAKEEYPPIPRVGANNERKATTGTPGKGRGSEKSSNGRKPLTPPRTGPLFGDSFLRDFRRRSEEAVNDVVSKIKSALDDSDDSDDNFGKDCGKGKGKYVGGGGHGAGIEARGISGGMGGASVKGRSEVRVSDDEFWNPFGDEVDNSEPLPLPQGQGGGNGGMRSAISSARRVEISTADRQRESWLSARKKLNAYYGGVDGNDSIGRSGDVGIEGTSMTSRGMASVEDSDYSVLVSGPVGNGKDGEKRDGDKLFDT
ncbi:unnamed protein product [Choristocarpus tenellus]